MSAMAARLSPPRRIAAPLVTFLVLGCALSWYPWVLHLIGRPGNGGPNPLGLLLAALIAAFVDQGWRGSLEILRSIVRVAAPVRVWAVALLLPFATLAAALAIAAVAGIAIAPKAVPWSDLLDRFIIMFLFVGLGEEPSWRGFLLPLLQRVQTPLAATLVVAVVWAIWHLPLMGTEFAWPLVPMFLISLFGAAFVQSWLYNASRGSSLLPMVLHGLINTFGSGYVFTLIAPAGLSRFWWIYSAIWLAAGLAIVIATRGRLAASDDSQA
jgi:membrane protease YdiL (CAAX protease family)